MKIIPDLTFDEQIERLIKFLSKYIFDIKNYNLLFYSSNEVEIIENQILIRKSKVFDKIEFKKRFEKLCQEGRGWINISGVGKTTQNNYLITYEYSNEKNKNIVAVNVSGPRTNIDGVIDEYASIKVFED